MVTHTPEVGECHHSAGRPCRETRRSPDDHIQDGAPHQGHAPDAGAREPLIIIVRSTDGIAVTLQDVTDAIPQARIRIQEQ